MGTSLLLPYSKIASNHHPGHSASHRLNLQGTGQRAAQNTDQKEHLIAVSGFSNSSYVGTTVKFLSKRHTEHITATPGLSKATATKAHL